jgi:hypothetical protein
MALFQDLPVFRNVYALTGQRVSVPPAKVAATLAAIQDSDAET